MGQVAEDSYESIFDAIKTVSVHYDGFYIKNKRIHLTYHYHINLQLYLEHINTLLSDKDNKILEYSMVCETGKKNNHQHSHIALKFDAPVRNVKWFRYKCPINPPSDPKYETPHFRKVTSADHWKNVLLYHQKDKNGVFTNTILPRRRNNIVPRQMEDRYIEEGPLGMINYVSDTNANEFSRLPHMINTVKLKLHEKRKDMKDDTTLTDQTMSNWMHYIVHFDIMKNDGVISWVFDPSNLEIRNDFAILLEHKFNALHFMSKDISRGMFNTVEERVLRNQKIKLIVFTIGDMNKPPKNFKETLMYLRMGRIYSKNNCLKLGYKPKILVLSNRPPDLSDGILDDLIILSLNEGKIRYFFADDTGREREQQLIKAKQILTKKGEVGPLISKYEPPLALWPIENFPEASTYYMDIIDDLIRNYKIPRIVTELRLLTAIERRERRIEILSPSTLRQQLSLEPIPTSFVQRDRIHRSLFSHEVITGKAWVLVDIQARNMTSEEIQISKHLDIKNEIKRMSDKSVSNSIILSDFINTYSKK